MKNLLNRLDNLGGIETENRAARWLERAAFFFLILMILSAPHSIAATQTAWLLGMTAWLVRFAFIKPRPPIVRTPLNVALWIFFFWTVITSVFSYAPDISTGKIHSAAIFLIFFFVLNNLRSVRAAKFLSFALLFSCMWSVLWSPVERIYGRGVQISGVGADSVLTKGVLFKHEIYQQKKGKNLNSFDDPNTENPKLAPLVEGDAILEVEGVKVRTPDELAAAIERNDQTFLECFRAPSYFTVKVRRENLNQSGANSLEKLGIETWRHSRNWRYGGFYGHIVTYAEVLQMIASLALGLFLACLLGRKEEKEKRRKGEKEKQQNNLPGGEKSARSFIKSPFLLFSSFPFLAFCFAAMVFALATTFTRSAQIALIASAIAMVAAAGSRKMILTLAIVAVPFALAGFLLIQQIRNVGVAGAPDESSSYRQTVWREGFNLWTSDARKFLLGIGMDSTKRFAKEWHLFDDGRLEVSHFHSTPLQLLVERGLPALVLWLWILWLYGRTLLRGISNCKFQISNSESSQSGIWNSEFGIILGCFGGLIGFFTSSAVNYSLGDGEVAMVFFMLMGIGVFLSEKIKR